MGLLKHQFYYKEAGVVAGTYTYTAYPDMPEPGIGGIQTTGSTTTIDATTAAQAPSAEAARVASVRISAAARRMVSVSGVGPGGNARDCRSTVSLEVALRELMVLPPPPGGSPRQV